MNSNPFPASFLNFKGTFKLSRVYIPGNQTFMVSLHCLRVFFASHQKLFPCPQLPWMCTVRLAFHTDRKVHKLHGQICCDMLMECVRLRVPRCNARRGLNQGSNSQMIEARSLRCLHLCVIA